MGLNNVLLPLVGESLQSVLCSVIITHSVVCLFMQMVAGVLLLFLWLLAAITSYWCWCGVVAATAVTTLRRRTTSPLFLTCYCCCIVILLISIHIILDTRYQSWRITLSWHKMTCSKWHSVASSDIWKLSTKMTLLYPCFIASKMHPWYIQLKPQQSPHPSQRQWSMTLVLTLHFTVWRIVEVSTKYRDSF